MGKGLGFNVQVGDEVTLMNIEKKFRIDDESSTNGFAQFISNLSEEQLRLTERIISFAKKELSVELSDYLYLGLTDHINFILKRIQDGINIRNPLLWEIKKSYPKEFEVGKYAKSLIQKQYQITVPEDEAGSIALHIVNAQKTINSINEIVKELDIIQDILRIIRYHFSINLDEDSINFERFFVHVKFFVYRVLNNTQLLGQNEMFYQKAVNEWKDSFDCVCKIAHYLEKAKDSKISDDEKFYMMVHIHRLTQR